MTVEPPTTLLDHAFRLARLDLSPSHRQPSTVKVAVATAAAIAGSLIADAVLAAIGVKVFPATKGYPHFRFPDYARLTIIGVVIAATAWPIVTRISAAPCWLFLRLAYLVSVVLLLPDIWLLWKHQPARAVLVLVVMHIAIAVITYNALVRGAPVRSGAAPGR
jgi:hypothetical protein